MELVLRAKAAFPTTKAAPVIVVLDEQPVNVYDVNYNFDADEDELDVVFDSASEDGIWYDGADGSWHQSEEEFEWMDVNSEDSDSDSEAEEAAVKEELVVINDL